MTRNGFPPTTWFFFLDRDGRQLDAIDVLDWAPSEQESYEAAHGAFYDRRRAAGLDVPSTGARSQRMKEAGR